MTTTLVILVVAIALLVSDRVRPDLVALMTAAALGVTGVLSPQEAFSGFGSRAAITILGIGILAEGLRVTGAAERAGLLMLRISGTSEARLIVTTMLAGAAVSLVMNNIAAGAVLLPAVASAARRAGVAPSRVMMPLAFGTILGGMATLLASTNLIVSDLLTESGHRGFGLFDFAPVGIPLVLAGTLYMLIWGRHRLPAVGPTVPPSSGRRRADLYSLYRLGERTRRTRIPDASPLAGRTLAQSRIREDFGLWVTAVQRGPSMFSTPAPDFLLQSGDVLSMIGRLSESNEEAVAERLVLLDDPLTHQPPDSRQSVVVEAVLPPRSPLTGRTLRDVRFADRFGMSVLAVWRGDRPIRSGVGDLPLQLGDALLLQGPHSNVERLRREDELIVLTEGETETAPGRWQTTVALGIAVLALALGARYPQAIGAFVLAGAALMVLAGILSMDRAHQAIDWRTIFLVAGMLPLGLALGKSGAAGLLSEGLVWLLGPLGPIALLGGVFLCAALLTQAVVGPAVAAVMGPVAIQVALQTGTDPRSLGMAVALACSMAFLTPLGHPVNVLVMGPGGYRFADYRRVGLPMAVVLAIVVMVVLPLVLPP